MESNKNYFNPLNAGLSEEDYQKIISVFVQFPQVEEVILYGSRAKGNYQTYSDIDITLKGSDLSLDIQHQIAIALDDLYLPYTFDLSILSAINNQELIDLINRVGILFYKSASIPN